MLHVPAHDHACLVIATMRMHIRLCSLANPRNVSRTLPPGRFGTRQTFCSCTLRWFLLKGCTALSLLPESPVLGAADVLALA